MLDNGGEEHLSRYVTATAMPSAASGQPGARPGDRRFRLRTLMANGTDLEDFEDFEDEFDDDELEDDDLDDEGFQEDDLDDDNG